MRVLLVNPPYQTFTSNLGVGHQIPLGLLMVGGPLLDAGHEVRLLDAECRHLAPEFIAEEAERGQADVVMTGHAGSTPAHPVCVETLRAVKARRPQIVTVYGGVYPTYHAREILEAEPAVDVIVRGEGEAGSLDLLEALRTAVDLRAVVGITFRGDGEIVATPDRNPERDLDRFRVGWELIEDWDRYQCFGMGRAAIVQFSRGCPYRCTYCGQHGFWVDWRYRDPVRLAAEIERLHREHDVRFITLADENPTTLQKPWLAFLRELAARRLPVQFFGTLRATDIVRDAEFLPLYREAGLLYILMGVDSTDEEILREIQKRSTTRQDYLACQLLRQHKIFSILGHIVGFREETWTTLATALRQLNLYNTDFLNAMFATPHSWTPFGEALAERGSIEPDLSKWDYRHQVLPQQHLRPWQLFLGVKLMELLFHLHPRRLFRLLGSRSAFRRQQAWWSFLHTGAVWAAEIFEFVARRLRVAAPRTSDAETVRVSPAEPRGDMVPLTSRGRT